MPRPAPSPRDQLIAIQRRLVTRLRREIFESLGPPSPEVSAYERRYERHFRRYRRAVHRDVLLDRLDRADVVLQGDFHTLDESQRAAQRLLGELLSRRELVLALEFVNEEHQRHLDAYLAGEIDEREFLRRIQYEVNWGFPWRRFRPFLDLAREHELQVYGLNTRPGGGPGSLIQRDEGAARVIARAALAHPESLIYAIVGDFHVCADHLGSRVRDCLVREGLRSDVVLVHQNVDAFYWDLARRRLERQAGVLEIGPDEFCLMTSTPLAKYQSYLHWELGQDEQLPGAGCLGETGSSALVAEEVKKILQTICHFLRLDPPPLDDFTVYTSSDLDFLDDLRQRGSFTDGEIREIERQVSIGESYFIPECRSIYLAGLSVDHAAEEASHYLNAKLAGHFTTPLPAKTDFYYRTIREALGFLGSLVINPLRFHYGEEDFRTICRRMKERPADAALAPVVRIARFVLKHLEAESRFLAGGGRPRLRAIYRQDVDSHLGITHALGYILGDRLYRGLVEGSMRRRDVRDLFTWRPSGEDEPEALYFSLVERLEGPVSQRRGA